ncbi:MAG TPA: OmpA family protein [Thermoanaerobaculia bacterium]|nr:OmpA family protein [Thermoanaerobaculia bacterium]
MKLTPLGKGVIVVALLVAAFFSIRQFAPGLLDKVVPAAKGREAVVPESADLPDLPASQAVNASNQPVTMPGEQPGCTDKPEVRLYHWAWNAHMGAMFANGGKQSTEGSLMCKNGVNLKFIREDDVSKMQEGLIAFASALKDGERNPTRGVHFVTIMGDGGAAFLKGLNDTLDRLGPEYRAKVVGSAGYSRGEDKFMGLPEWKQNPSTSRGGLVAGVLRDGDWNIAMKWLGDNGLCNNPDERTWDPNCLNWVAASDYIDASEKYVAGYCEDRPIVENGRRTGERKKVCVNGVVTWTPGDVIVAEKKGGLVSVVSTKEYASQMPNVVIGIDKWMKENRGTVEGMLQGFFEGADAVKSSPQALRKAAQISAEVYNESGADADYWEKYFDVVTERDKQGLRVELGGSSVNNLADNMVLFGLTPGSANLFGATYSVFGDIVKQQYPDLVPTYYPTSEILDTSYVQALASRAPQGTTQVAAAETPTFSSAAPVRNVVSRRAWNINFETGSANFTPETERQLDQLLRDLLVASSAAVEIHGHTDSVGNPQANMNLSEARAFAVKEWLERQNPANFPEGRLRVFAHGQENPVAPNSTDQGRARNRRVEIVIGTTGG